MDNLKPCPFCGAKAELVYLTIDCGDYPNEYEYFVACTYCFAETRHYEHPDIPNAKEYAMASWNTRALKKGCVK